MSDTDPCDSREILTVSDLLRYTEIRYLDAAFVVHKDVGTFDVTMDDVSLMQVVQTLENLPNKVFDERFLERSVITEKGSDGSTWDILEENV